MACAYITDLATNIWRDLGEPSDLSVPYIQTKLISPYFLGKLNVALGTAYEIVSGDISPALGTDEQGMYGLMYKIDYYARKINTLLSGYSADASWIELSDGDGRLRRASPTEIAKTITSIKNQLDLQLNGLVGKYRMNNAKSKSVDYFYKDDSGSGLPRDDYRVN